LFVMLGLTFLSCQKELEYDNNGASTGSFKKDAAGDCLPVVVNGVFKVDSVLSNALFVDVQVNVSFPGTFNIISDTVNGYSFSKTGNVVLGLNTIRLYPSGKPVAAGTNTFTVVYGSSTCSFDITVVGPAPPAAVFTLAGAPNLCTGAIPGGTFTVGVPLAPSNTLTIQVDVTTPGFYVIAAATTSGFAFTGSGLFIGTGLQTVTLTGTGTPSTAGTAIVTVTTPTLNTCTYDITVLPAGGGTAAVYTFDGGSGACTNFVVNGTYIIGSTVSAANTVTLQVTVTTPGTYTITTNTANGITFSKTGVFTTATPQTVVLNATGTIPATTTAGPSTFAPVGASTCNFIVNFVAAPPIPAGDYFPITANSWWSYDIIVGGVPEPDSVLHLSTVLKNLNSNTYRMFSQNVAGVTLDSLNYRKSGNDYYQWNPADYYSVFFSFDNEQFADILFLKENAATGTTWSSPEFTGTVSGVAAKLQYNFKIENANTGITVNSINYTNVIYVSVAVKISILGAPYTTTENNEYYYAKGIGFVKAKYKDATSGNTVVGEGNIRNYKVF
ncbi:MAG: hypothetical protein ACQUYJ_10100, partial [Ferruginibacter sp.]